MNGSQLSVAICTFNGERHIAEQLRSISQQTAPPVEVVVSDDGSTDRTLSIIRAMQSDPRFPLGRRLRILEPSRRPLGVAANFARALEACDSPFVAFADQDDVWLPRKLEAAIGTLVARPSTALVATDAALVDELGFPISATVFQTLGVPTGLHNSAPAAILAELTRRNFLPGMTLTVRRDWAKNVFPVPPEWLHDHWFTLVAAAGQSLAILPEALVNYRQHGRNVMGMAKPSGPLSPRHYVRRHLERDDARKWLAAEGRLQSLAGTVESPMAEVIAAKLELERARAGLGRNRRARIPAVAQQVRKGHYQRYARRGWATVTGDLLSPY